MIRSIMIGLIILCGMAGPAKAGTLVDNGDGTVTDTGTNLMWEQAQTVPPATYTWEEVITRCEDLVLPAAGYADWRLPNVKELLTIVDDTRYDPAIDPVCFPNTQSYAFWSSSTNFLSSTGAIAWGVEFYHGSASRNLNKTMKFPARCVRGGG
ncbi:MAG: DUF1566 domain-containing protein [Nitrospirota bacterium]|nr:DUF1566 domain-containing protein [Nitrospirota bacterium]